jgi:predicted nucleic acid-binding protein
MCLELAFARGADLLVSGDADLLAHRREVGFGIESPAEFKKRFEPTRDAHSR